MLISLNKFFADNEKKITILRVGGWMGEVDTTPIAFILTTFNLPNPHPHPHPPSGTLTHNSPIRTLTLTLTLTITLKMSIYLYLILNFSFSQFIALA
jgi:hypothetical protein